MNIITSAPKNIILHNNFIDSKKSIKTFQTNILSFKGNDIFENNQKKEDKVLINEKAKMPAERFFPKKIKLIVENAFYGFLSNHEYKKDISQRKKEFLKTQEGKRRASLSKKDIKLQAEQLNDEIFNDFGINESLRPKIKIYNKKEADTAYYLSNNHQIGINSYFYKAGIVNLNETLAHETIHAKQQLIRNSLSQEEKIELIKQYLQERITDCDTDYVANEKFNILSLVETPLMNDQMRKDFADFASKNLYQIERRYSSAELRKMLQPITDANIEFQNDNGGKETALYMLADYAQAHQSRYKNLLEKETKTSDLAYLSENSKEEAYEVFLDDLELIEKTTLNSFSEEFNYDYLFSKEEIAAEKFGSEFALNKLYNKMKEPLSLEEKERTLKEIKSLEANLEYIEIGSEYYKLYTESKRASSSKETEEKLFKLQSRMDELNDIIY